MPPVSRRVTPKSDSQTAPAAPPVLEDGFPDPQGYDLWDYMQALNPAQWNEHIGYLYRTDPAPAGGGYLHKFTAPIALDWVKQTYGGRSFEIKLKRGPRLVKTERFSIEAAPKNEAELGPPSGGTDKGHMEILRDLVDYLKQMRDEAAQQGRTIDLKASLNQALELQGEGLRAAVKAIAESAVNPKASTLETLLEPLLVRMLERSLDPPAAAPAPDIGAQVDKMFTLWDRIQDKLGIAETVRSDPWAAAFSNLLPHLPNLADRVVLAMQHYRDAQLARSGQPAIPPPTPAPPSDPRNLVVEMFREEDTGDELALVLEKTAPQFALDLASTLKSSPADLGADPILGPLAGDPRLAEFAKQYLAYFEPEPKPMARRSDKRPGATVTPGPDSARQEGGK